MLSASTTTITNPVFRWYSDAALTDLAFTGADFTATGLTVNTMFYVTVEGDGVCEGEAKKVNVEGGRRATAADITARDATSCGQEVTLTARSTVADAILNWSTDAAPPDMVHTVPETQATERAE